MTQQNWNPGGAVVSEPRVVGKDEPVAPDEAAFARFAELAAKLVQVPKRELDEQHKRSAAG